jgi:hypothetical protein
LCAASFFLVGAARCVFQHGTRRVYRSRDLYSWGNNPCAAVSSGQSYNQRISQIYL